MGESVRAEAMGPGVPLTGPGLLPPVLGQCPPSTHGGGHRTAPGSSRETEVHLKAYLGGFWPRQPLEPELRGVWNYRIGPGVVPAKKRPQE